MSPMEQAFDILEAVYEHEESTEFKVDFTKVQCSVILPAHVSLAGLRKLNYFDMLKIELSNEVSVISFNLA